MRDIAVKSVLTKLNLPEILTHIAFMPANDVKQYLSAVILAEGDIFLR